MTYGTLRSVDESVLEPFEPVVSPADEDEFARWGESHHINKDDLDEFSADDGSGHRFVG